MTSSIEKSLGRINAKIAAIGMGVDAMQNVAPLPSAFSSSRAHHVGDVIEAAGHDALAAASGRLRAIHEGPDGVESASPKTRFGKPAVKPVIIDGEVTEVKEG